MLPTRPLIGSISGERITDQWQAYSFALDGNRGALRLQHIVFGQMENLTDYKPLERVLLPGLGELECTGLVLIVGPNSSGKTLLLKDLHRYLSGDTRTLIVAEEIVLRVPEFDPFLKSIREAGYLSIRMDDRCPWRIPN